MSRILHITTAERWDPRARHYRGDTLESEGFIHCSTPEQLVEVANRLFRGRADLWLLHIDPARVTAEIRFENLEGGSEAYPHLYGPLDRAAVVLAEPFAPGPDGCFTTPRSLRRSATEARETR